MQTPCWFMEYETNAQLKSWGHSGATIIQLRVTVLTGKYCHKEVKWLGTGQSWSVVFWFISSMSPSGRLVDLQLRLFPEWCRTLDTSTWMLIPKPQYFIQDRLEEGSEVTKWQLKQEVVGSRDRSICFVLVIAGAFINWWHTWKPFSLMCPCSCSWSPCLPYTLSWRLSVPRWQRSRALWHTTISIDGYWSL